MGVTNQETASRGAPEICRGFVALDFRPCFGTIWNISWVSSVGFLWTCGISPTANKSGNMTMNWWSSWDFRASYWTHPVISGESLWVPNQLPQPLSRPTVVWPAPSVLWPAVAASRWPKWQTSVEKIRDQRPKDLLRMPLETGGEGVTTPVRKSPKALSGLRAGCQVSTPQYVGAKPCGVVGPPPYSFSIEYKTKPKSFFWSQWTLLLCRIDKDPGLSPVFGSASPSSQVKWSFSWHQFRH